MCLVKVRQEEDVVVPVRRVHRPRSPSPRRVSRSSHQHISRTSIVRESRPQSSSYIVAPPPPRPQPQPQPYYPTIPAPQHLPIPAPQPAPMFVEPMPPPPPPPPPQSHYGGGSHAGGSYAGGRGHPYVEVSPRSSVTSHSPSLASEYVVHEREYRRERHHSPDSPRYETYRYVESDPHGERYERYTRRERSRSRDSRGYSDYEAGLGPRASYRETRERIVVDDGGRRPREYRR
ncbi:hypothetical protein GQ43DRAFT_440221 [Delitschia confertaspora ATCC 74209]|uniref:Uncharacterized protein n=1 Tax=Delitschia confertaspora ATCC 74209 TaxID=1513339 RepID=A0A9P4JRC9_9PLEO|nr:hypothetical protein GQ43DRAFT_440221 [Delitschia confertaspora ATCC 74209]